MTVHHILVVEDNPDNMKLFRWVLEDEGYRVLPATSAEEGLDILQSAQVDLVLMDISLPGMDGKEATRRVRSQERYAGLPVLAVTAHAIAFEREEILSCGFSALVTKPIEESLLLECVRCHLAGRVASDG